MTTKVSPQDLLSNITWAASYTDFKLNVFETATRRADQERICFCYFSSTCRHQPRILLDFSQLASLSTVAGCEKRVSRQRLKPGLDTDRAKRVFSFPDSTQ
jgi:hypothetical protein